MTIIQNLTISPAVMVDRLITVHHHFILHHLPMPINMDVPPINRNVPPSTSRVYATEHYSRTPPKIKTTHINTSPYSQNTSPNDHNA